MIFLEKYIITPLSYQLVDVFCFRVVKGFSNTCYNIISRKSSTHKDF